jgi:hypothetical protein
VAAPGGAQAGDHKGTVVPLFSRGGDVYDDELFVVG